MTEVPGSAWGEDAGSPADAPFPADWRAAGSVVHVFTHFRLELSVYCAHHVPMKKLPAGFWWSASASLPGEALPSVMKKAIEAALPGATKKAKRAA
jgi:A/G-specific adenine glycosylase